MKNLVRVRKGTEAAQPKRSSKEREVEKTQKKAEKQAEKDSHPLLSTSEFRTMAVPSFIVWGAAQMDPWVLGNDEAVKSAFKKIADEIWLQGSEKVNDLVMEMVSYFP